MPLHRVVGSPITRRVSRHRRVASHLALWLIRAVSPVREAEVHAACNRRRRDGRRRASAELLRDLKEYFGFLVQRRPVQPAQLPELPVEISSEDSSEDEAPVQVKQDLTGGPNCVNRRVAGLGPRILACHYSGGGTHASLCCPPPCRRTSPFAVAPPDSGAATAGSAARSRLVLAIEELAAMDRQPEPPQLMQPQHVPQQLFPPAAAATNRLGTHCGCANKLS